MFLKQGYLLCHPPIIIPEIGKGMEKNCQATLDSYHKIGMEIKEMQPEIIVLLTPHGAVFRDALSIHMENKAYGSLQSFNYDRDFEFDVDLKLSKEISKNVNKLDIPVFENTKYHSSIYNVPINLDHGSLVPLYYILREYTNFKLVSISAGMFDVKKQYEIGMAIKKAIEKRRKRTIIIASGDMSHCLSHSSPYKYNKNGKVHDEKMIDNIKKQDIRGILEFDKNLVEDAGVCGYGTLSILLGAFDGNIVSSNFLSYDNAFGVGYLNAEFRKLDKEYSLYDDLFSMDDSKDFPVVKLAKLAVEKYIQEDRMIDVFEVDKELELISAKPVFVSIKKKGNLRGCIGSTVATEENIGDQVIKYAVYAASQDPRFNPVTDDELEDLTYSVDILEEAQICDFEDLDPKKYGIVVERGARKGILLPDLEGVDTRDMQVSIALEKARISKNEKYIIKRFRVRRYR